MESFLTQNKSLLTFYGKVARAVGWVLLVGGLLWFLAFIFWILAIKDASGELVDQIMPKLQRNTVYAISAFINDFTLPGMIALGLSQLLRFLLEPENKGGWILRHGHWILFSFAFVFVGEVCLNTNFLPGTRNPDARGLLLVSPLLVPMLARVLIVVGLGVVLKRMIAIIDESKTLV